MKFLVSFAVLAVLQFVACEDYYTESNSTGEF
jgi:hypothetical protein